MDGFLDIMANFAAMIFFFLTMNQSLEGSELLRMAVHIKTRRLAHWLCHEVTIAVLDNQNPDLIK